MPRGDTSRHEDGSPTELMLQTEVRLILEPVEELLDVLERSVGVSLRRGQFCVEVGRKFPSILEKQTQIFRKVS